MCGRFLLSSGSLAEVAAAVGADWDPSFQGLYRPRFNIPPGSRHWLLRSALGRRSLFGADWGLVNRFAKNDKARFRQFNARAETLSERPAFRDAFAKRRCAVPASGFYEWTGEKSARHPLRFHRKNGELMWFAGLYEDWQNPETGEVLTTFTVVTREASAQVLPVHDRMPAILGPKQLQPWLERCGGQELLLPAKEIALVITPASRRLNSARNDEPSLLVADAPTPEAQLSLF